MKKGRKVKKKKETVRKKDEKKSVMKLRLYRAATHTYLGKIKESVMEEGNEKEERKEASEGKIETRKNPLEGKKSEEGRKRRKER